MTIKLDKLVSALAALMISTASFVAVTDAQARESDDLNSSEEPRCEGRTYGPSHHPARKRRGMRCDRDEVSEEGANMQGRPCTAFAPTLKNPTGE
ncbi:hypothetical protein AAV99_01715 [Aurantiacibacter marinus]|uniref:Uncharacterized protein n=1 Tax=Aurantiacibacter marinus TaxID=874156 RepID=A0A0H0XP61_9SPHN|nr:hypothetical protein AAV99_01715 [Aurantiacibacter marinus]